MSIRVAVRGAQCSVRRSPGTAARIRMACGGGVPLDYSLFSQLLHHSPTGCLGRWSPSSMNRGRVLVTTIIGQFCFFLLFFLFNCAKSCIFVRVTTEYTVKTIQYEEKMFVMGRSVVGRHGSGTGSYGMACGRDRSSTGCPLVVLVKCC